MISREQLQDLSTLSKSKIVDDAFNHLKKVIAVEMIRTAEQGLYEGQYYGYSYDPAFDKVKKFEFREGIGKGFVVHFLDYFIRNEIKPLTKITMEHIINEQGNDVILYSWIDNNGTYF